MERKRKKINNAEEMIDALGEDYFLYDHLAQMEVEAIQHNINRSDAKVPENGELEEAPGHKKNIRQYFNG